MSQETPDRTEMSFDKELRLFISRCREIIRAHPACQGEHPALVCLNKYQDMYAKTSDDVQHRLHFETFFNRNRALILNTLNSDEWLKSGNYYIQYGEGTEKATSYKQYRIMLGFIYRIGCEVRDQALDRLDSLDNAGQMAMGGHDLIYPEIFLLHLAKVLACVCAENDKAKLLEIVESLRRSVKGEPATPDPPKTPVVAAPPLGDFSALFNSLQGIMGGQGVGAPGQGGDMANLFGGFFANPAFQRAMGNITEGFSQGKSFGEIASVAMQEIQSPEIMECVQQTISDPKATALIQQLTSAPEVTNLLGSLGGSIPGLPAAEAGPKGEEPNIRL